MKKKIISLLLISIVSCSVLVSCGSSNADSDSSSTTESSENIESVENTEGENSDGTYVNQFDVSGDAVKPTPVTKIISLSDIKEKDANTVKSVLGDPISTSDNIMTYEKSDYTFEITYFDSVAGKVKITPKNEFKFPVDAANLLQILSINPSASDEMSPSAMVWNNKFDTYKVTVTCDLDAPAEEGKVSDKLKDIEVIFAEQYK